LAKKSVEALIKANVRGTYSTALTKLLLDDNFEMVKEKAKEIRKVVA